MFVLSFECLLFCIESLQHYKVDWKEKNVELTEEGVAAAELALDTEDLWDERDPWARYVVMFRVFFRLLKVYHEQFVEDVMSVDVMSVNVSLERKLQQKVIVTDFKQSPITHK